MKLRLSEEWFKQTIPLEEGFDVAAGSGNTMKTKEQIKELDLMLHGNYYEVDGKRVNPMDVKLLENGRGVVTTRIKQFFCETCGKFQPVVVEELQPLDFIDGKKASGGDIVCKGCHFVIACQRELTHEVPVSNVEVTVSSDV